MTEHPFTDPISGEIVTLHMGDSAGVEHPRCAFRAKVFPNLDAFWCDYCHWNGRISGAWFMDLLSRETHHG